MIDVSRIVYPTDFSDCADDTLPHALDLAEHFDAELHILHALVLQEFGIDDPAQTFVDAEEIERRLEELAQSRLADVAEQKSDRVRIVEAQRRGSAAAEVIVDYAEEVGGELIVMGTHGRRGLRRFFLGSVAQEVVRSARCPVLTLRHPETVKPIRRILLPLDLSESSRAAADWARALTICYGAEIQILHVVEPAYVPYQYGMAPLAVTTLSREQELDGARTSLERTVEEAEELDESWERHVAAGHPASEIVRWVEEGKADMIVLASHGHTGLDRVLLGSTAEQVVRTAACPVLTVRLTSQGS